MQDAIDIKVLQTLGMARDRPSPYGSPRDGLCTTVARGPVPRNLSLSEAGSAGSGGFAAAHAVPPRNPLQVRKDLHVYRKTGRPPLSRSVRTLIKQHLGEQLHIKVLQTLGSAMQNAIDIKVLRTLGMARDRPSPYERRGFKPRLPGMRCCAYLHRARAPHLALFERAGSQTGTLFRSARTCMSIEKRACHRFQGPLGP